MSKKIIVITGATGGVGSMLCHGLAKQGHHIVGLCRNEKRLLDLAESIQARDGEASYVTVDMVNKQMLEMATEKILTERGSIDVWINNVGVNNHNAIGPTWQLKAENWWTEVTLNLYTAFLGTRAAINAMKGKNSGYVINLGGGGVDTPKPYGSAYGASKAAVVKFTETVNLELQKEGLEIKVFAFNPGFIRNKRTAKLVDSQKGKQYMPELGKIFHDGQMSNIEDSIDLINLIMSGEMDPIAGRYFHADDQDKGDWMDRMDEFIKAEKNVLRLRV